jgi:tetratricopeptide (TPR) repeat protein
MAVRTGTAALLIMLFTGVIGLHVLQARERMALPGGAAPEVLYLQSPELASRAALSFDSLLADLYWIRAVQYYGRTKLTTAVDNDYALLFPLLDLATTLDPKFDVAYRFGAIFLAEPLPNGAGRPDRAVALLEKGLRSQPEKWQFAGDIGFVHYFWRRDYESAAEWFRRASRMPGGPDWMAALAATVLNQGGNRLTSRRLWQEILQGDNPPYLRDLARVRLLQLDALDQLDTLNRAVGAYQERTGSRPESWRSLVAARVLTGVPLDPAGVPYRYDPRTGVVELATESPLQPLPLSEPPQ